MLLLNDIDVKLDDLQSGLNGINVDTIRKLVNMGQTGIKLQVLGKLFKGSSVNWETNSFARYDYGFNSRTLHHILRGGSLMVK